MEFSWICTFWLICIHINNDTLLIGVSNLNVGILYITYLDVDIEIFTIVLTYWLAISYIMINGVLMFWISNCCSYNAG